MSVCAVCLGWEMVGYDQRQRPIPCEACREAVAFRVRTLREELEQSEIGRRTLRKRFWWCDCPWPGTARCQCPPDEPEPPVTAAAA